MGDSPVGSVSGPERVRSPRHCVGAHLGLRDRRERVETRERSVDVVSRVASRRKFSRAVGPRGGPMGAGFIWLFRV